MSDQNLPLGTPVGLRLDALGVWFELSLLGFGGLVLWAALGSASVRFVSVQLALLEDFLVFLHNAPYVFAWEFINATVGIWFVVFYFFFWEFVFGTFGNERWEPVVGFLQERCPLLLCNDLLFYWQNVSLLLRLMIHWLYYELGSSICLRKRCQFVHSLRVLFLKAPLHLLRLAKDLFGAYLGWLGSKVRCEVTKKVVCTILYFFLFS